MSIDEMNYENDPRVRAANRTSRYERVDTRNMTLAIRLDDEDDDDDDDGDDDGDEHERTDDGNGRLVVLPMKFIVCRTCDGKGTHVNPSIDASGLTREDFDDDPDFREDYQSGLYDVQCYGCSGARVVPTIDTARLTDEQKPLVARFRARQREDREYEAMCRAERAMGA